MYKLGLQENLSGHFAIEHGHNYFLLADQLNDFLPLQNLLLSSFKSQSNQFFLLSPVIETLHLTLLTSSELELQNRNHRVNWFNIEINSYTQFNQKTIKRLFNELYIYDGFYNALTVLHLPANQLVNIDEVALVKLLEYLDLLAKKHQLALIILITGEQLSILNEKLTHFPKLISGLAKIEDLLDIYQLKVNFWHHCLGQFINQEFEINKSTSILQLVLPNNEPETSNINSTFYDEDEVWMVRNAVPDFNQMPANYNALEDNQALFEQANQLISGTVVFVITKYISVINLAKQCFELRKKRGPWLKIVLQNLDGVVRHKDESIFYLAGVNLILYDYSHPSRFISRIMSIQGFKFTRTLPNTFNVISEKIEATKQFGYRNAMDFFNQVIKASANADSLSVSGALVRLTLLPSTRAVHALKLIRLKRDGDLFSNFQDEILIYLGACRPSDVQTALENLFYLDVDDFFMAKAVTTQHFYIQEFCRKQLKSPSIKQSDDLAKYLSHELVVDTVYDSFDIELMNNPRVKIPEESFLQPIALKVKQ
ncbi:cellulose biosynthesis protein BcsE [Catenovulum sp. 2E275]|uniref:cellulose biosynthesis protein BcsE n=1 Tax=Catenovulum sp. 2E275 TaxID=2980497 RepID=UPI0021CF72BC|nr:cellulose biosynthesis protein BcsE [Catenovulum sp. 2E275]MCU4677039.1 cellulose biosynthesis protein BcsE [Catenovulum sp. 2E275]